MRLAHVRVRRSGFEVHAWDGPEGLAAVRLGSVPDVATEAGGRPVAGLTITEGGPRLELLRDALSAYLAGQPLTWDGDLDLRGVTEFQQDVFEAVRNVSYGRVSTYREIARRIGRPQAVRAVGSALHRNPFPLIVPCHRVLREGGALGGYAGGSEAKRRLLALESGQMELGYPGEPR